MDSERAALAGERTPARRPAPAQRPIVDVIRDRWSPRAIDAERAVAASQVATLLEAARWAPSNGNAQPWRYLVFDDTVAQARPGPIAELEPSRRQRELRDRRRRPVNETAFVGGYDGPGFA